MITQSLLDITQQDTQLKRVSTHRGGEYHGPCPFCGGKDRFRVQPERDFWTCRQCGLHGDLVAYLVESGRMTKAEAYNARHGGAVPLRGSKTAQLTPPTPEVATPPGKAWQARAWEFVYHCQAALWDDIGKRALAWLRKRGLSDTAIQTGGLGYNSADTWEDRETWGLQGELDKNGKPKRVWLPRGVTIPWFVGPDLWRVNIRRPVGDPKYIGPAGWGNALYNADDLRTDRPAVLVEGELDALTLDALRGIITPCATGSVGGARRARWIAKLALCPVVLVAFDADQAGEDARRYWLKVLPNGRYWRPFWGDANAMHNGGVNLRAWVDAGLRGSHATRHA